jgi:DNA invertase Pin-like site-specific DNA recombinase
MTFVAYYRVSTTKQGISGLGLDAQQRAVREYLQSDPLMSFTEVESGGKCERPQLKLALEYCKSTNSTLVIAKLDRLSRNLHFISGLMESGVDFISVDNPNANKLMVHLLAAFAEHERDLVSVRTKGAYKSHTKGTWGKVSDKTLSKRTEEKLEYLKSIKGLIETYTLEELNALDVRTRSGARITKFNLYRMKRELAKCQ